VSNDSVDVVIVGAGFAGLRAADILKKAGCRIKLLEARDRVGGRVFSERFEGATLEMGGRWISSGQEEVAALAARFGRALYRPQVAGRSCESYLNQPFAGISAEPGLIAAVRDIDALAETVDCQEPWLTPNAVDLDSKTLRSYLDSKFDHRTVEIINQKLCAFLPDASDVSLLHALFYLKSNHGFSGILGLDDALHDEFLIEGGAFSLAERLAADFTNDIVFSSPVHEIHWSDGEVIAKSGRTLVSATAAIISLPPVLSGRIDYSPSLPVERDYLTQRAPIRGKYSFAFVFDEPYWRKAGLNGFANDEYLSCWDPGGQNHPGLIQGLLSIPESRRVANLSTEDRSKSIKERMSSLLGLDLPEARHFTDIYWAAERYSRGCNSYLTPGVWTTLGAAFRRPVGPIHWAGAEYSAAWVGQIDGALASGRSAADGVLGNTPNA
jgi:monoamine oxidase